MTPFSVEKGVFFVYNGVTNKTQRRKTMNGYYPYGVPSYMGANYQRQMPNSPMQYQPQMTPQAQPQQMYDLPIHETRYATRQEAESHIMFPNTKVLLIDKNSGMAFLKSADNMGQSAIKYFQFTEINADGTPIKAQEITPNIDMGEYIKKSDLVNYGFVTIEQLDKALEKLTSQQNQINTQKPQTPKQAPQGSNLSVKRQGGISE